MNLITFTYTRECAHCKTLHREPAVKCVSCQRVMNNRDQRFYQSDRKVGDVVQSLDGRKYQVRTDHSLMRLS